MHESKIVQVLCRCYGASGDDIASMGGLLTERWLHRRRSRGCPEGPHHVLVPQFLCATGRPVSSSRPTLDRAGARRSGSRMARERRRKAWALTAPSTTAYLAQVGDEEIEGSPACGGRLL